MLTKPGLWLPGNRDEDRGFGQESAGFFFGRSHRFPLDLKATVGSCWPAGRPLIAIPGQGPWVGHTQLWAALGWRKVLRSVFWPILIFFSGTCAPISRYSPIVDNVIADSNIFLELMHPSPAAGNNSFSVSHWELPSAATTVSPKVVPHPDGDRRSRMAKAGV